MTRRFAADTSVPMDCSISDIRTTVGRYGATEFAHMESDVQAAITFTMCCRRILFRLTRPDLKAREFTVTETGKARSASVAKASWEQACRSPLAGARPSHQGEARSRREVGIVVFECELLANTMPPGASVTLGETVRENMRLAHENRSITRLLSHSGGSDAS